MNICKEVERWVCDSLDGSSYSIEFSGVLSPEDSIIAHGELMECRELFSSVIYSDPNKIIPAQTTKKKVIEQMILLACAGISVKWFGCIVREAYRLEKAYPCTANDCLCDCVYVYLRIGCRHESAMLNIMTAYALLRNYGLNLNEAIKARDQ
jgi:hypothetical protein